jgi:hypothetical protein
MALYSVSIRLCKQHLGIKDLKSWAVSDVAMEVEDQTHLTWISSEKASPSKLWSYILFQTCGPGILDF